MKNLLFFAGIVGLLQAIAGAIYNSELVGKTFSEIRQYAREHLTTSVMLMMLNFVFAFLVEPGGVYLAYKHGRGVWPEISLVALCIFLSWIDLRVQLRKSRNPHSIPGRSQALVWTKAILFAVPTAYLIFLATKLTD